MLNDKLIRSSEENVVVIAGASSLSGILGHITAVRVKAVSGNWGELPIVGVYSSLGLLIMAIADNGARIEEIWAYSLFWVGLLVLFVPIAFRLTALEAERHERIGLIMLLGLALYLVKVLHSPVAFTFSDEFSHWRSVTDIDRSSHLFTPNPLLPISSLYPGLALMTHAFMKVSGLPVFAAGIIVLGMARLVLVLGLYLFFEHISKSPRIAGIALLLYTANPNFVFWGAQFAYESLSLPIAALILFALAYRSRWRSEERFGLNLVIIIALGGLVITHHMTAYVLIGFLVLCLAVSFVKQHQMRLKDVIGGVMQWYLGEISGRQFAKTLSQGFGRAWKKSNQLSDRDQQQNYLRGTILLLLVLSVTWLMYIATYTIGYLAPHLAGGVLELLQMIIGEESARELFNAGGQATPLLERVIGFLSIGLILLGLPFGLFRVWRRYQSNVLAIVLSVVVLAYPVTLGLRLTQKGQETANRASEFLFVGIAFILAIVAIEIWLKQHYGRVRPLIFTICASILFMGGITIGWAYYARLPGPYLVSAVPRSIEPQSISASTWTKFFLGTGNRFIADRANRMLLATYGGQRPVTIYNDGINSSIVVMSTEYGAADQEILHKGMIQYTLIDRRLSTGLPFVGFYFERGEPDTFTHISPIAPNALTKFDNLEHVSRIFDSGAIQIYDVRILSGAH